MNTKVLWITKTAVFIALLVCIQAVTAPLGNTLITGSLVNMILAVSVIICGLPSGLSVALVSPVFAFLFGIGTPFILIVPFIMIGNMVLVLAWHFLGNKRFGNEYISYIVALVVAAIAKFLALYLGIVRIAIPFLLDLQEKQVEVLSATFSVPQLFTALIGGAIATAILPVLKKAVVRN